MLVIEQYEIKLKRLTHDDIELVRKWRNDPKIRKHMAFKKHITKEMQEAWFTSINNKYNYYFLIEHKGEYIGVIDNKKINWEKRSGEGGIFIWNTQSKHEFAPVLASLCLLNLVAHLNLLRKSFVQILNTNTKSVAYNKALGYSLLPGQEKQKNQYYLLIKEDYLEKTEKLRIFAAKYSNDFEPPRISGEASDLNLDSINEFLMNKK
jgi:RimJ/RimL family protein N-acetyltransferase